MLLSEQLVARKVPEGSTWTCREEHPHDTGVASFFPEAGVNITAPLTKVPLVLGARYVDSSQVSLKTHPMVGRSSCPHFTGKEINNHHNGTNGGQALC